MYNDSKEYSRFLSLYSECKKELENLNIPFGRIAELKVSHTLNSYGDCRKISNLYYRIRVNKTLLEEASDDSIKNTIIHEMLHTCPDCFNHGKTWQAYANLVNDAYPKYCISRLGSYEETHVRLKNENNAKYVITCKSCGHKYFYYRNCRIVKLISNNNDLCRCAFCKNNNLSLEVKR